MNIYLIGSLRNEKVPQIGNILRKAFPSTASNPRTQVFDDWFAAGPEADDYWRKYELSRGRTFIEALEGKAAENTFTFDKLHLDSADVGVLVLPCGKSGHLELGYLRGRGRPAIVLLEEGEDNTRRWDLMYKLATHVVVGVEELIEVVNSIQARRVKGNLT